MQENVQFEVKPGLSRFEIFRNPSTEPKRAAEADTIVPFLLRLDQIITLEDVNFGPDSPDFVFRHSGRRIGVELTSLVPKEFAHGGYVRKADFKLWKETTKKNPQPRHEFEWGEATLRESLAAFASQFDGKCQRVKNWKGTFTENWLLMHVGSGSPFGGLVATSRKDTIGRATEVDDYFAKITHALFTVCERPHPFHYVILFSGMELLAFPSGGINPHGFPSPQASVLARGAAASDRFLDWRSTNKSIVEYPYLESDPKRKIVT